MAEERRYWNEEMETMPPDKMKKLQEERLQALVTHAYEKTALYRRKFDEAGVKPADIKTLEDLRKLPLTDDVIDIRGKPVSEKLAIPEEEIKMFHSTSGTTTGIPEPIPFSKKDVAVFFDGEARFRWTFGVRPWDVIQILTGFDCCAIGCSHYLGATTVLASAGRGFMDRQISLTKAAGVTVLEHMPSMILKYFERAKELGVDIRETKVRMISGVGEGWAESYKKKVEAEYGLPFMTGYGSVEAGVYAAECEERRGMHIFSDVIILEVIDPETKEPLPPGQEGELISTSLLNDAMPLIRYRMGDVGSILPYEPCPCGRILPKMGMVKGRLSQMIKVKDKKVFPIDVEEIAASVEELTGDYQIIVDRPGELDRLKVKMEYKPGVENLTALKSQIEETLYRDLGTESEVELVPVGAIGRALFKAQRVIKSY